MPLPNYHRFLELLCKTQQTSSEIAEVEAVRASLVRRVSHLGSMDAADAHDLVADHIEKLLRLGLARMSGAERAVYAYGMVAALNHRMIDLARKRARTPSNSGRPEEHDPNDDPLASIPAPDCAAETELKHDLEVLVRQAQAALNGPGIDLDREVAHFCTLLFEEVITCVRAGEPVKPHLHKQLLSRGWSEQRVRNTSDRAFRLGPVRNFMRSLERLARDTQSHSAAPNPEDRTDVR